MSLVEASSAPVPETTLDQPELIRWQLVQAMALAVPGLVVRNVSEDPDLAHKQLDEITYPVVSYGAPDWRWPFSVTKSRGGDGDTHLDLHRARNRLQLNEYTVQEGELIVRLLRLQPHIAQAIVGGAQPRDFTYGGKTSPSGRIKVDNENVVPIAHTAHLFPGDVLYFADSRFAHQFRSEVRPRQSKATIYHPQPTELAFTIRAIQRQIDQPELLDPYTCIFPEAAEFLRLSGSVDIRDGHDALSIQL